MSRSYIQQKVLCPFYRGDDGKLFVRCEGVDGDETSLRVQFKRKASWERYVTKYCCRHYEQCWLHAMLMAHKYPDPPASKSARAGIEKSETGVIQWVHRL